MKRSTGKLFALILLGVATVLFVGAAFVKNAPGWLVPAGLACVSAALFVEEF